MARGDGSGGIDDLILQAVRDKQSKGGAAYAAGKTLVVFLENGGGSWYPNRVARQLPAELKFDAVWVVGLQGVEDGRYVYGVTLLDVRDGNAPTWCVVIANDFCSWKVEAVQ